MNWLGAQSQRRGRDILSDRLTVVGERLIVRCVDNKKYTRTLAQSFKMMLHVG